MSKQQARIERQLLENLLDGLDRIYDGESQAYDLHPLVYATLAALSESCHSEILQAVETELLKIARSGRSLERKRNDVLMATDKLRIYLANRTELKIARPDC